MSIELSYLSCLAVFGIFTMGVASAIFIWLSPSGAAHFLPTGTRLQTLDGLRGLLALSVAVHHTLLRLWVMHTGHEGLPPSNFQMELGSGSVAIFFMLSAYLFCGKLYRSDGRLSIRKLAIDRIARIVPIYAVAVLVVSLIAVAQQHFVLVGGPIKLAKEVGRLFSFDFLTVYSLNDTVAQNLIGQRWTLRYEWLLYVSLPFLALMMRRSGRYEAVLVGLAALSIWDRRFAFFTTGAVAVTLVEIENKSFRVAVRVLGGAGLFIGFFIIHESTGWLAAIAYLPFLVAVAQGGRPYRLLSSRPLRLLGEISFSLYLMHGIAFEVFDVLIGSRMEGTNVADLVFIIGRLASAVLIAMAAYMLVERPSMLWRIRARESRSNLQGH